MEGEGRLHGGFCGTGKDHFVVEELLNFSGEGISDGDDGGSEEAEGNCSTDSCSNSFFVGGSLASRFSGDLFCRSLADAGISGDFCVPKEELAELEWLSNFVEGSFTGEEAQKAVEATGGLSKPQFLAEETPAVPGKARSKRARRALHTWSSRLPHFLPRLEKTATASKACLHCGADRTPQWRAGPMGQKTLCNACGVRFKSGRLVPEYRPAASPTFVLSMHSNSHRKVMELRRQKEILLQQEENRLRRCCAKK